MTDRLRDDPGISINCMFGTAKMGALRLALVHFVSTEKNKSIEHRIAAAQLLDEIEVQITPDFPADHWLSSVKRSDPRFPKIDPGAPPPNDYE